MSIDPLSALLETLTSGDEAAAERAFAVYEPYLRKVVRRRIPQRLRSKFDSCDVVQSVWAGLWGKLSSARWRFADVEHLRAFLVEVTRNRFIDRLRKHRAASKHEQPLERTSPQEIPASREPRPSELAQANELWQKMLSYCPPAYHEILAFRRSGLSLAEIATRTGMHEGSIRRIIRKISRQVAMEQSAGDSSGQLL
jgi:RNA polymerase sigma-70 factor (ECF subfamily)